MRLARRASAPGETDDPAWLRVGEAHQPDIVIPALQLDAQFWQQRHAETVSHHLDDSRQIGSAERIDVVDAPQTAERQRLIAQTMAFLKQQQTVLLQKIR